MRSLTDLMVSVMSILLSLAVIGIVLKRPEESGQAVAWAVAQAERFVTAAARGYTAARAAAEDHPATPAAADTVNGVRESRGDDASGDETRMSGRRTERSLVAVMLIAIVGGVMWATRRAGTAAADEWTVTQP